MEKIILLVSFLFWTAACNPLHDNGVEDNAMPEIIERPTGYEKQRIQETRPKLNEMFTSALISLESKEIVLEDSLQTNKHLTLRSDGSSWPVILEVRGPDGSSTYYFQQQKLIAIETPAQHFILENDKLKVWTNKNWIPYQNKSTGEWLDQETALLNEVGNYLAAFDINY